MARKRLIHPGAPKDEGVASCSIPARLVWAFLPCHADRAGRLVDKPFFLRCEMFPTDQGIDVDALLGELAAANLITRYEAAGRRFIQIRSFLGYQTPHKNEARSLIQPPPEGPAEVPEWLEPTGHDDATPEMSGEAETCPEDSRQVMTNPSGSGSLDPDPVPDPVKPDTDGARAGDPTAGAPKQQPVPPRAPPQPAPPPDNVHRYDRTPGGLVWTADHIMATFGKVRGKVFPKSIDFHVAGAGIRANAEQVSVKLDASPEYAQHIEATMLLHLQRAKASPNPKDREVSWCFGQWVSRLPELLEEALGLRNGPDAPADQPCDFHGGDRNQGKAAPRHLFKKTCGECRHLHARASPRPPATEGPTSAGQVLGGFTSGR